MHLFRTSLLGCAALLLTATQSFGVILYRSPTRNTTAPTGFYANSGWQYEGQFFNILGTPVAPNWFITAAHPGGVNTFTYKGVLYHVDTSFLGSGPGWINGPHSDLRLWKVQEAFPDWAPLWDASVDGSEVGRDMVAIGRGTQRGAEIYGMASAPRDGQTTPGTRPPVTELKGWAVGASDAVQSWGANYVDSIFDASQFDLGDLITFDFDRLSPLCEECMLSNGDSGGAIFVKSSSGTWKLAGLNFSVDGPFRVRPTSENFLGAPFDMGGLYIADNPVFQVPDGAADVPASSYASRVSSNLPWIRSIIGNPGPSPINAPEPAGAVIAMIGIATLETRRPRRAGRD
jgi:hypothetical protein